MNNTTHTAFEVRGNYIQGAFRLPEHPGGVIRDVNPGDPSDVVGEFPWQVSAIDEAIAAARGAFASWRDTPQAERSALLRRYADALARRKEHMAEAISREMGKALWEARGEAGAMVAKVGITLEDGLRLVADHQPEGVQGAGAVPASGGDGGHRALQFPGPPAQWPHRACLGDREHGHL
jgi:acyl-CoA reductase-like NAD-dependent aldehyde dehydrogenase